MSKNIISYLKKNNILVKCNKFGKLHAILTSGYHSDTYINLNKLYENSNFTRILINEIFNNKKISIQEIADSCECIGGLLTLGSHISTLLPEIYPEFRNKQRIIFNKKEDKKISRWQENEIKSPVLLVDDVFTTGSSIKHIIENSHSLRFSKYILVLVNRSSYDYIVINDICYEIISGVKIDSEIYEADECPFCQAGSIAVKPKYNWDLFVKTNKPKFPASFTF